MVALAGTFIAFFLCLYLGRFSEAIIFGAITSFFGLFFNRGRDFGIYVIVISLSISYMVSSAYSYSWIIPFLAIVFTRFSLRTDNFNKNIFFWIIFFPAALLFVQSKDRDVIAVVWAIVALTIPMLRGNVTLCKISNSTKRIIEIAVIVVIVIFICKLSAFAINNHKSKVVILDGGKWARTEPIPSIDGQINMSSMYSYSSFRNILEANVITVSDLKDEIGEAWLITPTTPFSVSDKERLLSWIKRGGHLIVITDHTDLFGHGRVVNDLLGECNVKSSYTSFFPSPLSKDKSAQISLGWPVRLKTSNTVYGFWLWPQISARWVEEPADYSGDNFFGPMSIIGNNGFGRRTISGVMECGNGRITFFGDSTVFSNFALFQPGTIDLLERLRNPGFICHLFPYLSLAYIFGFLWIIVSGHDRPIRILSLVGVAALIDAETRHVRWQEFEWWSGDSKLVMEWSDPCESVSTVYSFFMTGGRVPRWTDDCRNKPTGIWVSKFPPQQPGWRWLDISRSNTLASVYDERMNPLLNDINNFNPLDWPLNPMHNNIKVGGIWTNDIMGDWWVDRGISKSKRTRLKAFINWTKGLPLPEPTSPYKSTNKELRKYQLRISGGSYHELIIPYLDLNEGDHVYIGKGVSADVVKIDNKIVLLGLAPYTEGWNAPSAWVLKPIDDSDQSIKSSSP